MIIDLMSRIDFNEHSLFSMFTASTFKIPEFQRPYEWEKEQVEELLDDIFESWGTGSDSYFLGPVVVTSVEGTSGTAELQVLDGQQRITTLSIIFCFIANLLIKIPEKHFDYMNCHLCLRNIGDHSLRLQPQESRASDSDAIVYKDIVLKTNEINPLFKKHAMVKALYVIENWFANKKILLSDTMPTEDFMRFLSYLTTKVFFARGYASDFATAFRLFESLNDRGMPLQRSDLIKNKVYSLLDSTDYERVKNSWFEIEEYVGRKNMDLFLRYYYNSEKKFIRNEELFVKYKNEYFQNKTVNSRRVAILVCEKLEPSAKIFKDLQNPSAHFSSSLTPATVQRLKRLNFLGVKTHLPFLLSVYRNDMVHFEKAVQFVESVTIRYLVIDGHSANKLEPMYARMANNILEGESFSDVVKKSQVWNLISNDEQIIETLVQKDIPVSSAVWRLLLHHLELIKWKNTELRGPKEVQIEHIFPQSPSPECYSTSNISPSSKALYVNKLGNLTLLYGKLNNLARNSSFSSKKQYYESSEIKMTLALLSKEDWGAEDIQERTIHLAQELCSLFPHPAEFID